MKRALILSGGGARAAYQVGVLKALADILPPHLHHPFPIICGTSAGAINATALAAHPGNFRQAVRDLVSMWEALSPHHVYNHQWSDLLCGVGRVGLSFFNQGMSKSRPLSLLDNSPLHELLTESINFSFIRRAITKGKLSALSITAMGYSSGESVSFFEGEKHLQGWRQARRAGLPSIITVDHLLASSAIPAVFPPVHLNREYFGDGAVRQLAPISPALHLGAEQVFVIGVSGNRNPKHWARGAEDVKHSPSFAQIVGHMLNSAFIDSLEGDLEHLDRLNSLIDMVPEDVRQAHQLPLRPVQSLVIEPTRQLDVIAGRNIKYLPKSLRFFLQSAGASRRGGGAAAASYLLFANGFIRELIELGYKDTMWDRERVSNFFGTDTGDKDKVNKLSTKEQGKPSICQILSRK